jgi:hypothetical protein
MFLPRSWIIGEGSGFRPMQVKNNVAASRYSAATLSEQHVGLVCLQQLEKAARHV